MSLRYRTTPNKNRTYTDFTASDLKEAVDREYGLRPKSDADQLYMYVMRRYVHWAIRPAALRRLCHVITSREDVRWPYGLRMFRSPMIQLYLGYSDAYIAAFRTGKKKPTANARIMIENMLISIRTELASTSNVTNKTIHRLSPAYLAIIFPYKRAYISELLHGRKSWSDNVNAEMVDALPVVLHHVVQSSAWVSPTLKKIEALLSSK